MIKESVELSQGYFLLSLIFFLTYAFCADLYGNINFVTSSRCTLYE
jgi:hypothetical protein